jgi:two-component system chemotaxis response regulator CheY
MKIMLVDDSRTMRNIQKGVLAQMGHSEITEACDGTDALSKVLADQPDLIILDWNMPNMDGLSFLKEFRKSNKDAKVIMCTTEAEKMRVVSALQAGANNYIIKPFTPDAFRDRIQKTMGEAA